MCCVPALLLADLRRVMMPAVLFSQCAACVVVLSSGDAVQCVACVACLENRVIGCYSGMVDALRVFACVVIRRVVFFCVRMAVWMPVLACALLCDIRFMVM